MSLREYQKKRDFQRTAEPEGKTAASGSGRLFVVQKHDASRLHYDFRLELDGVLKSWAVPKGFSPKRGDRRLAVHVEDHPLDYANFEGTIPQGEYGGGTVMVWDYGTYEVFGDAHEGLRQGKLHCLLKGQKLKGEWTLVHAGQGDEDKNWFLIKTGEDVRPVSKKAEEHSALSGRTMAGIAGQTDAVWHSNRPTKGVKAPAKSSRRKAPRALPKPVWVEPMKATLVDTPPTGGKWLYELKWDGYRALALKHGREVELISRNQKPLTADFPELRDALATLPAETALLDGEICALDSKGRPAFQLLQGRGMTRTRPLLCFYAFDLLELNGQSLTHQPLLERKAKLQELLAGAPPDAVRYSAPIKGAVEDLLAAVRAQGMEGLIGKVADSLYRPATRSREWVKLKVSAEQEFVIGGFSPPKGTRKHLGALLVGYYEKGKLQFAGKVGTGFNETWLRRLHGLFRERQTLACPFVKIKPGGGRWGQGMTAAEIRQCTWVRPELVCQVKFAEWTDEGQLRHAVFLGLREDKPASEVRRELPA